MEVEPESLGKEPRRKWSKTKGSAVATARLLAPWKKAETDSNSLYKYLLYSRSRLKNEYIYKICQTSFGGTGCTRSLCALFFITFYQTSVIFSHIQSIPTDSLQQVGVGQTCVSKGLKINQHGAPKPAYAGFHVHIKFLHIKYSSDSRLLTCLLYPGLSVNRPYASNQLLLWGKIVNCNTLKGHGSIMVQFIIP